ncbi:tripartite motif-containing protein 16-like protein [Neolamprologus brichardi]|uniref:tripartite motif-containing protein 16-like protein n=1 Tax=Neolamprologus brichardi TaxID=32507 RepID=UPI0016437951|nr:tripartite motif-containing protein 16-like protein [Neolamprologus brichardi]
MAQKGVQHKGHETVPAAAERTEKQKELEVRRLNIQQRIQEREKDVKLLQQEVEAINGSADKLLSPPEPKTRAGFLKYSHEITLDPNTANTHLLLSEDSRKVTIMRQKQSYSDHPERFTGWLQVLSRESLTGCCYWEVEWRGRGVGLAVAYKDIGRAGSLDESKFGFNDKSWSLRCDINGFQFWHNEVQTVLSGPRSSRVGVYLDHRAGILSFYSVSETMTLLHRVQTTFTQPLYAGLRPDNVSLNMLFRSRGVLEPISAVLGQEAGYRA